MYKKREASVRRKSNIVAYFGCFRENMRKHMCRIVVNKCGYLGGFFEDFGSTDESTLFGKIEKGIEPKENSSASKKFCRD